MSPICGEFEFTCWNSSQHRCIEASMRCNGIQNCDNKEDEMDCGGKLKLLVWGRAWVWCMHRNDPGSVYGLGVLLRLHFFHNFHIV